MNLLLLTPEDFINKETLRISDRRSEHLRKILKVSPGQKITAGMINGSLGVATIMAIEQKSICLSFVAEREPPAPFCCTLILALPRPLMLKRILQSVTSLGVKDIHLIQTEAVEKSYWNSSDLSDTTIQQQLLLGLEQSIDTRIPSVTLHRHFKTFTSQVLPNLAKDAYALIAHPGEHMPCPANKHEPTVLAIGPEGGFTTKEIDIFTQHGFSKVQIGPRILRVETAVNVLLGKLLAN